MRILYLVKSFANKAGMERVICDKINYLSELGYDISLVTYEQGNHPYAYPLHPSVCFMDLNTRFFKVSQFPLYKRPFLLWKLRTQFRTRFQKAIKEINPDIIISTTYSLYLMDIILSVNTRARHIVESHVACYTVKKSFDYRNNKLASHVGNLYDSYMFKKINKCDRLVALTTGDASDWNHYVSNVMVIPNFATLFPETVSSHVDTNYRMIAVGRLHEQKGFDMLIDAFSLVASRIPNWTLCIFGSGGDKEVLNEKIIINRLQNRVHIIAPTEHIYDEYQKSDFLVLSSRYEGLALVLIEAMSCGIPCIAFRCKYGPEDVITHQKDGILVTNGDVKELADQILWMATHKDERLQMGVAARETARHYQKETIMRKWIDLFESLKK